MVRFVRFLPVRALLFADFRLHGRDVAAIVALDCVEYGLRLGRAETSFALLSACTVLAVLAALLILLLGLVHVLLDVLGGLLQGGVGADDEQGVQVLDDLGQQALGLGAGGLHLANDVGGSLGLALLHQLLNLSGQRVGLRDEGGEAHGLQVGHVGGLCEHLGDVLPLGVLRHQRLVAAVVDCLEQREPSCSKHEWPSRDRQRRSQVLEGLVDAAAAKGIGLVGQFHPVAGHPLDDHRQFVAGGVLGVDGLGEERLGGLLVGHVVAQHALVQQCAQLADAGVLASRW